MIKLIIFVFSFFIHNQVIAGANKCTSPSGDVIYQTAPCDRFSHSKRVGEIYSGNVVRLEYINEVQKRPISINLEGMEIGTFFNMMSKLLEINIKLSSSVNGYINLSFEKTPVEDIINYVFEMHGLDYYILNGELIVGYIDEIYMFKKSQ